MVRSTVNGKIVDEAGASVAMNRLTIIQPGILQNRASRVQLNNTKALFVTMRFAIRNAFRYKSLALKFLSKSFARMS